MAFAWRWHLAVLLIAPAAFGADIQTLSGKKLAGEPVGLDKQALILKTPDGEVRHPITDILQVGLGGDFTPMPGPWVDVELTDGTLLHCTKIEFRGALVEVTTTADRQVQVTMSSVSSICRDAHNPKTKAEFAQFAAKRGRFDIVAVQSEGRLNGLEGTLGSALPSNDGLEFAVNGSDLKTSPKLAKVAGFVFANRLKTDAPPAICRVTDAGRNVLVAADVQWNDAGIVVTTVAGLPMRYSAQKVVRLDFSSGKLVWLSDLTPTAADMHINSEDNANFGQFMRYRRDKNLENGPLRMDGVAYARGLGIHAGATLTYDLDGRYTQFRTLVGVDESVQTDSRVEIVIEGDGRELYRGQIGRRDPPRPLTLDVKDVRQFKIDIRPVGLLELGGEVNLADAKVSK